MGLYYYFAKFSFNPSIIISILELFVYGSTFASNFGSAHSVDNQTAHKMSEIVEETEMMHFKRLFHVQKFHQKKIVTKNKIAIVWN